MEPAFTTRGLDAVVVQQSFGQVGIIGRTDTCKSREREPRRQVVGPGRRAAPPALKEPFTKSRIGRIAEQLSRIKQPVESNCVAPEPNRKVESQRPLCNAVQNGL